MDDIAKQVAHLSPAKLALLELRLKRKAAPSDTPEVILPTGDITEQVARLSPAKLALLELRLKGKTVPIDTSERIPPTDDITEQVARLSPAKLALLELRLKRKTVPVDAPERESPTGAIAEQVARLSPAKLALLELRLRQQSADTLDIPVEESLPADIAGVEVETEIPDRPIDLSILTDLVDAESESEVKEETPAWLSDLPLTREDAPPAQVEAVEPTETETAETGMEELDWLSGTVFEEIETPDWLLDGLGVSDQEGATPSSSDVAGFVETDASSPPPATAQPTPAENKSGWLATLRPTDEALVEDSESKTAEATGMLAGLSSLLPAEKSPVPSPEGKKDDLFEAAQEFYNIATQAPQPAVLPVPLTRREKMVGNAVKAVLYLLFIALVALPLVPGLQKVVDAETDRRVPWTEPAGDSSDVLDSQRRQLISEQLGIIDLQLPESVALVSFDYSAATQGEMQPLAEAVLGRLKGQRMRIISISLEPEGAAIAQKTLDDILTKRGGQYGLDAVNLGYLPGQVAAVRELATAPNALSAIADFKDGLKFDDPARAAWNDVQNLGQVDVIVTIADNPATARWWIEQLEMAPPPDGGERFLLAATSANAAPLLQPYRDSNQLNGLISGVNGAAAIEAGRNYFGPARKMLDSQSVAHLIIVILIAIGTMVGWMPPDKPPASSTAEQENGQNVATMNKEKES